MGEQLEPLWRNEQLRSRVRLALYPYGNAQAINGNSVSDGYKFWHRELRSAGGD